MKRLGLILSLFLLVFSVNLKAQDDVAVGVAHDGLGLIQLDAITIEGKRPSAKQVRQFQKKVRKFNKLRYNVMKTYPMATQAATVLMEIDSATATMTNEKAISAYMKSKEKDLFGEYEGQIRKMTFSQGKILIKLIDRQTGKSSFALIKELKSGTSAFFWNAVGKLFGYNLKDTYDERGDDLAIELIVRSIETGTNVTYYDYLEVASR